MLARASLWSTIDCTADCAVISMRSSRTFCVMLRRSADLSDIPRPQTYETVDRQELDPFEQGCSLISVSFAEDPNVYYAVGSAHVVADEPEPTKVQLPNQFPRSAVELGCCLGHWRASMYPQSSIADVVKRPNLC